MRPVEPRAEPLVLPAGYGRPSGQLITWHTVSDRLAEAPRYWLTTVRPSGRPHVVPTDGLWVDGSLWFGGDAETVHLRNLRVNPAAAVNLEDGKRAVIVEGDAVPTVPSAAQVGALVDLSRSKYGYAPAAESYKVGVWRLLPHRVLAWEAFPVDATRFWFDRRE